MVSDSEADATYNTACAWMFGTTEPQATSPKTAGLKRQIASLQNQIQQRVTDNTKQVAEPYDITDIRHPEHHQHREFQKLRGKIVYALKHQKYMRDFNPLYVPTTSSCPETFERLTDLLRERVGVEQALENLLDDVDSSGAPLDQKRGIEPEYHRMSQTVAELNRHLFTTYVRFLPHDDTPIGASTTHSSSQTRLKPSIPAMCSMRKRDPGDFEQEKYAVNAARSKETARINAEKSSERTKARDLSKATRERIAVQSAPYTSTQSSSTSDQEEPVNTGAVLAPVVVPLILRQSNRSQTNKRTRYEPLAMGQGSTNSNAFMAGGTESSLSHFIVGTGASHVLFKERDSSILANIQMSPVGSSPFAILRAANGAFLSAIGRGMLTIGSVTVIAYLFRDSDLVHPLLGIAPFADLGCTATFTAEQFTLHHHGKKPLLVGTRHTGNLWKIALSKHHHPAPPIPTVSTGPVLLLHQTQQQSDRDHVRFVHATLGSPPPTTFMRAVANGYINGPRQYPRLTTAMVRKNMPNSEATARGHLRKSPTSQPHEESDAVSARQRHHKAAVIKELLRTT